MRIIIDPGHGGSKGQADPGAVDPVQPYREDMLYTEEDDMAFDIADRARLLLETQGHEVHLTRRPNQFISLQGRCDFANQLKADIFVSIHLNAHRDPAVRGIEVFSFPGSIRGAQLRNAVYMEIMRLFPDWIGRGTKKARFYVLRKTIMPACLVECGFITNEAEEKAIHKEETRQRFAEGIVNGIGAYFCARRG